MPWPRLTKSLQQIQRAYAIHGKRMHAEFVGSSAAPNRAANLTGKSLDGEALGNLVN